MKYTFYLLIIGSFFTFHPLNAQTRPHFKEVRQGIEHIYNQEFDQATVVINNLEQELQGSAIPDLMKALKIYWMYNPVYLQEDRLAQYQSYLEKAYRRSEKVLEVDPGNPEAIFLALAAQGLLAESYAESGRSFKAVGAAKKAYNYIKMGRGKTSELKEFYLSTGLYNYYREYYPETYPIYKPFMSFFMKGDKQKGIQQLEKAAKEASVSHVIAKYYLSYIYMRYEYSPAKALRQAKNLYETYPNNLPFNAIYLESLVINGRYQDAQIIARKLQRQNSPYLSIYGDLFMGVIYEKHLKQPEEAEKMYRKTIALNDRHDMEREHLMTIAYLGLGRIYQQKSDPKARGYFKEALNSASTRQLKSEAKSYLN